MYLDRVRDELQAIREAGRYRHIERPAGEAVIDFSSNDYLGLSTDKSVVQALRNARRAGAGGARLLAGRSQEHALLEEELAGWLGRERALLFSSGYHAALGVTTVLAGLASHIYSDRLNHASLIDGMRLSNTARTIYPHLQLPAGREAPALVVSETVFGMDGDCADVASLLAALNPADVLILDEAHALGVCGMEGAGLARPFEDRRIVVVGTLSKAFGGQGGFVAGPSPLIDLLVNTARTFIYDTALPPALALAARISLVRLRHDEGRRATLQAHANRLRDGLRAMGLPAADSTSPVVPVVIGDERRTLDVSARLLERNIAVAAIRPPTVPVGTSRLRISLRADHSSEHVDMLLAELRRCIVTS